MEKNWTIPLWYIEMDPNKTFVKITHLNLKANYDYSHN